MKMQTNVQHSMQQNTIKQSLRQQDISLIIKHFSFTIQQRFQQIQKNCNYFTCLNSINYQRSDIQKDILHRYNEYKTTNQQQIKLLQKFIDRILQIFQFFRQKTDQPQILHTMGQKIGQKMKQILKNQNNYHFFINNRPKTHTTNVKPLGNRSASNDFLSIIGPSCKNDIDINAVFINNGKKVRTQTQQKRIVQVGKLFKYIFSVLKRGFLIKLRMQKPEKKPKSALKDLIIVQQNTTISVQGTCAILRDYSQKGNKQNYQSQGSRMQNPCKQKTNIFSNSQNKKQFYISQKVKNRSISTNQYSILSKQYPSMLKQSTSKIRQLDKKVNMLYEILNVQKYSLVRVAKDPQLFKKQQIKRNQWIQAESKKYLTDYAKWIIRNNNQDEIKQNLKIEEIQRDICMEKQISQNVHNQIIQYNEEFKQNNQLKKNNAQIIIEQFFKPIQNEKQIQSNFICPSYEFENLKISKSVKTQQNQLVNKYQDQKNIQSSVHTIIVCSSRNYYDQQNILADKSSNLFDIDIENRKIKEFNSRPIKNDRKSLRLNLPTMLGDKSNIMNQPNIRQINLTNIQKNSRHSQKQQYYIHSYHIDSVDDGSFVPLLPRRQKNAQNIYETKNQSNSLKRKNIVPNFHPLNRCRIFREKKKNCSMIQGSENKIFGLDEAILKGKLKNVML